MSNFSGSHQRLLSGFFCVDPHCLPQGGGNSHFLFLGSLPSGRFGGLYRGHGGEAAIVRLLLTLKNTLRCMYVHTVVWVGAIHSPYLATLCHKFHNYALCFFLINQDGLFKRKKPPQIDLEEALLFF